MRHAIGTCLARAALATQSTNGRTTTNAKLLADNVELQARRANTHPPTQPPPTTHLRKRRTLLGECGGGPADGRGGCDGRGRGRLRLLNLLLRFVVERLRCLLLLLLLVVGAAQRLAAVVAVGGRWAAADGAVGGRR